jgi:hypothetical protein
MIASSRTRILRFAMAGGVILASACAMMALANAQDTRARQQQACSRDVSRHCRKQMNDGDMAIYQCLQQNRERLSPACRNVVDLH